jgi:hypothetical protein
MNFLLFAGSAWSDRHQAIVVIGVGVLLLIASAL